MIKDKATVDCMNKILEGIGGLSHFFEEEKKENCIINACLLKNIIENLLNVSISMMELERKSLPLLNKNMIKITENPNVSNLIELQKNYVDVYEKVAKGSEYICKSIDEIKENVEIVPEIEIEKFNVSEEDEIETVEMCSNVASVKINVPLVNECLDISLENCTKNQLIMMLLSAISVIGLMDTTENDYNTHIITTIMQKIYHNFSDEEISDNVKEDYEYDDNDNIFDEKMEDLLLNENVRQSVKNSKKSDYSKNANKTPQKKQMEEVMADVDEFNKTAVEDIIEGIEEKISKAEHKILLMKKIIEENEKLLDEFKNEIPSIDKETKNEKKRGNK